MLDKQIGEIENNSNKDTIADRFENRMISDGNDVDIFYDETDKGYIVTYHETNNSYLVDENGNITETQLTGESYIVKFYDDNGETLLETKIVRTGKVSYKAPSKQDWQYNYTFEKWVNKEDETDIDLTNINQNMELKATYKTTDYLTLGSADDFKAFRDKINSGETFQNKTLRLTEDIDLNKGKWQVGQDQKGNRIISFSEDAYQWNAIGTPENPFKGVFEGNNHKIEGIYINTTDSHQGLFGVNKGTIRNLAVDGAITGTALRLGGICGYNEGEINECTNYCNIQSTSVNTGGIAGCSKGGKILNCINYGFINANETSGGIIGQVLDGSAQVESCANYASINSTGNFTGGIAGSITSVNGNVTGCKNEGIIQGSASYVGGIIGYSSGDVNQMKSLEVLCCYNTSHIKGTAYVGRYCSD